MFKDIRRPKNKNKLKNRLFKVEKLRQFIKRANSLLKLNLKLIRLSKYSNICLSIYKWFYRRSTQKIIKT